MVKEMNREIFQNNLLMAIEEIKEKKSITMNKYTFIINPIVEEGKPRFALDEFMRLNVLNPEFIKGRKFSLEEVVTILSFHSPFVPIFINVKMVNILGNEFCLQLDVSLRFRKPSLLRNAETGHAPFKVII